MGLLNPLLLLLAGAAAVPLLLHLFQRHQGPRVTFPALRYLLRAEKESARRIRLRQLLLMLLRVAAVLLFALAAARPFLPFGGGEHSPTAVVIILDNSMSTAAVTGEARVLDMLRERALETLENAGPDDRFWLIRAGRSEPALSGDATSLALHVRETEPAAGRADLVAALERARGILGSAAEGRAQEIHLLTDLQATSFTGTAADSDSPPVIIWHPPEPPPANRAVAALEVGGGLAPMAGQRYTVAVSVAGSGDSATVRVHIEDRLVAAGETAPGSAVVLSLPPREAGVVAGRAELDADALRADDVRYWVARVEPPPAVRVTGDAPFVEDALEVLAASGRIRRDGAADVVVAPGASGIASSRTAAVILPPESPVQLGAVNRALTAAGIPWRYDPPAGGEARFAPSADPALDRALADARVTQSYPLVRTDGAAGDSVLLRLADGTAWAVRGTRAGGGEYVLLGSPLVPASTSVPTTAAMLPLMDRITTAWARASSVRTEAQPGEEIVLPATATAVQRPDGTRDDVQPGAAYRLGDTPGIYRILRGEVVLDARAVNPAAEESELARMDEAELRARLPGWSLERTTDPATFGRRVFHERLGREVWRPLVLAGLLVLLLETMIAASGRTAARQTRGTGPVEAEVS